MNLTPHEREIIAQCLNDMADEMDAMIRHRQSMLAAGRTLDLSGVVDLQHSTAVQSVVTSQMRDIAFKVEWGW